MHIKSRESWNARPWREFTFQPDSIIREFFIHHPADLSHDLAHIDTDQEQDSYLRGVQNFHMDNPDRHWDDIGYSHIVFQDGTVVKGRGRNHVPAAQLGHNTGTIAVLCVLANGEHPSARMIAALVSLKDRMDRLVGRDLRVRAHGDVTQTECPGPELRAIIPSLNRH